MKIIRVALNTPVDCLFDYIAPEATQNDIGLRVRVPFGKKLMTGIIMGVGTDTLVLPEKLKPAEYIFREIPPLPTQLLDLFRFCSDYYHHPLGMVVINGLPGKLRDHKQIKPKKSVGNFHYCFTDVGKRVDLSFIPTRNTVQRRILEQLRTHENLSVKLAKQIHW